MYKSEFLTYNPDAVSEALTESEKMIDKATFNQFKSINSSIPNGFRSADALTNVVSKLDDTNEKLTNVKSFLTTVKSELDQYVQANTLSSDLLKMKGYFPTTIAGVAGYLYIPPGDYTSTAGLPIITWLSGMAEYTSQSRLNLSGIGKLLSEGYTPNAVVWVPTGTASGKWGEYDMKNVVNSIDTLIDTYKLDADRNSLIGYSLGGIGGYKFISENPDYFSAFVSYGAYPFIYNYDALAKSNTTIMIYSGSKDSESYQWAVSGFKELNNRGADVMMYNIEGATHSEEEKILTVEMIEDLINIRKSKTYVKNGEGQMITVGHDEFVNSAIEQKILTGTASNATYYKPLVSEEERKSNNMINIKNNVEGLADMSNTSGSTNTPGTSNTSDTSNTSGSTNTPGTSNTPGSTNTPGTSNTSGSTNTPGTSNTSGSTNTPGTSNTPGSTNTSGTSNTSGSTNTSGTSNTPGTSNTSDLDVTANILPNNRFSDVLPEITSGNVESMEISKSFVSYEISDVEEKVYTTYISKLEESGYEFVDNKWVKGDYEVIIEYNSGKLNIQANMK